MLSWHVINKTENRLCLVYSFQHFYGACMLVETYNRLAITGYWFDSEGNKRTDARLYKIKYVPVFIVNFVIWLAKKKYKCIYTKDKTTSKVYTHRRR